jgi:hypothetical protein
MLPVPEQALSARCFFQPHAEIGYESNGKSILTGDIVGPVATNTKGSLPNQFNFTVWADVSITKRLTGPFDIFGQRLFGVPQLFPTTYTDQGKCNDVDGTTVIPGTSHADLRVHTNTDYNITNASLGLRFRALHHYLTASSLSKDLREANKTALWSERSGVVEKSLKGPTLL